MWELILILNHIIIIPLSFARFDSLVYVFVYNTVLGSSIQMMHKQIQICQTFIFVYFSNIMVVTVSLHIFCHTVDMSNLLHRIKQSISFNQSVNHAGLKYNTKWQIQHVQCKTNIKLLHVNKTERNRLSRTRELHTQMMGKCIGNFI